MPRLGPLGLAFNSLFEMLRIVSEGEGRVGYRYTFNSLFEMRLIRAVRGRAGATREAFNSLFEMP